VQLARGARGPDDENDPQWVEQWLSEHLARAREVRERVLRPPIVGLGRPELDGRCSEWSHGSEGVGVTVCYGSPVSAAGVYVEIQTYLGVAESSLVDLLAEERDRLFKMAEIDEPEATQVSERALVLELAGVRLLLDSRAEDGLWAARGLLPKQLEIGGRYLDAAVSIVARGLTADQLALGLVEDLEPLLTRGDEWLRASIERRRSRSRPPRPLPPAGLDGHEELLRWLLADAATRGDDHHGRHPRRPAGERSHVWETAVLGQMHLANQSHDDANDEITRMANHVSSLARSVPWWPEYGSDVVAETIRFTAFESDVSSRTAQLAWRDHFANERGPFALESQLMSAEQRFGRDLSRQRWLDAWDTWYRSRSDRRPAPPE
jgi:hypothetical protein